MRHQLEQQVAEACKSLFDADVRVELTRPEEQFGDFSTNAALQLAKRLGRNPREIAEALAVNLRETLAGTVADVAVAGPGFINLTLNDETLLAALDAEPAQTLADQVIVAEYSDPNPFKVLHAGHLYTTIVGNAIGNLLETAGATVHRVNFGGDVGLHVGKTMWGVIRQSGGPDLDEAETRRYVVEELAKRPLADRAAEMAACYVEGNNAYEDDPAAKEQIVAFNKRVYGLHETDDRASDFAQVYWVCRDWSYEYFRSFYEQLGVEPFEKIYPESETTPIGIATVKEQLEKGVYEQSDGAVVFRGEPYGLHTRVFINSQGLPTYEAKDVGLIMKKWSDYHFDTSVIITGNDIVEYMKVVLKSIEQFQPELVRKSKHLTHGQVKLEGGVKMSSRKGNVLYADDILEAAEAAAGKVGGDQARAQTQPAGGRDRSAGGQTSRDTAYSAVKYAFLKQRLGGDIIYNPEESVALEGNSGPYLQYAHARARSILRKAEGEAADNAVSTDAAPAAIAAATSLEAAERSLVRKIGEYPEVIDRAVRDLMPHHICTYLYELAQVFNRFYEHNRVIGDPRQTVRLALVARYADTLRDGLRVLGIASPDKM